MTPLPHNQTLHALLQREQQQRDLALARLGLAETAAAQAHEQTAQLLAYRGEYEARWATRFNRGGTVPILQCYRDFTQRLDQAVRQQQQQAARADARREQLRAELLACERQLASVRKLIERRGADERRSSQRREQKSNDDLAQRMRWQRAQRSGLMPLS